MYCGDQLIDVHDILAGEEMTICIPLTSPTSGGRCMYQNGTNRIDTGVTTVGAENYLNWPVSTNASNQVCCKTNHLSDFVVVEGLYVNAYVPARGAANVSKHTNISLTFSLPIAIGQGELIFTPSGGEETFHDDSESIHVDIAQALIVNGSTLTIDFPAALDDRLDKQWSVSLSSGAVRDTSGEIYQGFNSTQWTFELQDSSGPVMISSTPSAGSIYVALDSTILMTFDETVEWIGNITLIPTYKGSTFWGEFYGGVQQRIETGDPQVVLSGENVTITPTDTLAPGVTWTVVLDTGTFQDRQAPANPVAGFSFDFVTRVTVVSTIPLANTGEHMQTTQIQLTYDGPVSEGVGHVVLQDVTHTEAAATTISYKVTYEMYGYHVDRVKHQSLYFHVGNTYIFDLGHYTMPEKPLVLLDSNGDVYSVGVTYTLDGFVKTSVQYIDEFEAASTRTLSYTPTSATTLTYDCYVETGVGGSINVLNQATQNVDITSAAITDGNLEVHWGNDHSNHSLTIMGRMVTITPARPLPASSTIMATVATGVVKNHLGLFALNFTTCDCVCRSNSPYEIDAGNSVGHISSGIDRTAGSRLCQWQLTAPPGRVVSISLINLYIPPSVNDTANPSLVDDPNCVSDYLELCDGDSAQGRVVWRKCRSDFNTAEVFEMTSNQLYLVLSTSGPSNASFVAEYGDSQKQLDLVFTPQDANSPPVMMGIPISVSWSTVYPLPSSGTSWVGLFEEGACDEDTEWRHDCYLAAKTLQAATSDGAVEFTYPEYRSAGYFELRFFSGSNQGRTCNVRNRYYTETSNEHDLASVIDDDALQYSKCQLTALASVTVYVAPAGSVPQEHVPGLREFDSSYMLIQ